MDFNLSETQFLHMEYGVITSWHKVVVYNAFLYNVFIYKIASTASITSAVILKKVI